LIIKIILILNYLRWVRKMSLKIIIEPKILKFDRAKLEEWEKVNGNTNAFGENIVKVHLESQGYKCIQHDYNILGGNKEGKYPDAEIVLKKYFGSEKYDSARKLYSTMLPLRDPKKAPFEEPDMLVYKPDLTELKFVEVKRTDTGDRLRKKQVRGLLLLSCFLNVDIDVFVLVPNDIQYNNSHIVWEFPTNIID
jgi:hypothetical protein